MEVSELTGLEFAELLHKVCERLENENELVVQIERPCGNKAFILLADWEDVYAYIETSFGEDYLMAAQGHITSKIKL